MIRYTLTKTPLCISNTDTKKEQIHTRYPYYFCSIFGASKYDIESNKGNKRTWWRHQMETFSALLAICGGIHRPPVNSPHKGQWRGALVYSLICTRINGWVNNGEAGDLRRHRAHHDVIVMRWLILMTHRMFWKMPLPDYRCMMHLETICVVYDNASQDPILLRQIGENNTEIMAWTSKYINRNVWDVIQHLWHNFSHGLAKPLPKWLRQRFS